MDVVNLSEKFQQHGDLVERVLAKSGVDVRQCYQCGKCSASCQFGNDWDYSPNRAIRMVQLGMEEELLNSKAIWMCQLCSTCTARCPRKIDPPRIFDALRIEAKKRGITQNVKNCNVFHDVFIKNIAAHDKLYELGLIINCSLGTNLVFLKDNFSVGIPTVLRGKLSFLPPKGKGKVRRIIENIKKMEGGK